MTLKMGIERLLKQKVPATKEVSRSIDFRLVSG